MGLISFSARSDNKHKRDATDIAFRITGKELTHFLHFPVFLFLYFQITIFVLCSTVTGYNQFHFFITNYIGPCPSGWTHFKSYCYFVSSAVKSWQAARTYCKSKGGDLVKIHSDEENEFVLNLVYKHAPSTKQVWIGLKWNARLSKFIWADNALPKYTNWNPGEPNGQASEPCSNMWTGHAGGSSGYWNDRPCLNRVFPCGLVCKRLP